MCRELETIYKGYRWCCVSAKVAWSVVLRLGNERLEGLRVLGLGNRAMVFLKLLDVVGEEFTEDFCKCRV